jgi:hypothetical protein
MTDSVRRNTPIEGQFSTQAYSEERLPDVRRMADTFQRGDDTSCGGLREAKPEPGEREAPGRVEARRAKTQRVKIRPFMQKLNISHLSRHISHLSI